MTDVATRATARIRDGYKPEEAIRHEQDAKGVADAVLTRVMKSLADPYKSRLDIMAEIIPIIQKGRDDG